MEGYDQFKNKNLEQLQELEDDVEDDFMKSYMEKRLNEMKELAKKNKYGSV
jgi:hypothetical protein